MPSRWIRFLLFCQLLFRSAALMLTALFVLVIALQPVPLSVSQYVWSVCLLIMLYLALVSRVNIPSDDFIPVESRKDIERLLESRSHWQHAGSSDAHVNMGNYVRVGEVPEHLSTQTDTLITDNLDRLVAIKKQGYWLSSSK